jgi:hypothetical protein
LEYFVSSSLHHTKHLFNPAEDNMQAVQTQKQLGYSSKNHAQSFLKQKLHPHSLKRGRDKEKELNIGTQLLIISGHKVKVSSSHLMQVKCNQIF